MVFVVLGFGQGYNLSQSEPSLDLFTRPTVATLAPIYRARMSRGDV